MNTESDTCTTGRNFVRALFLHGKTAAPSIVPADCARYGCVVETAMYGVTALNHLLRRDFDVIVVSIEEGDAASFSVFLKEIRRIWPWLGWVVTGQSSTPEAEQLARELETESILFEPGCAEKVCEFISNAAALKRTTCGSDTEPAPPSYYQDTQRCLGFMVQNAMKIPALTLSGILSHISHKLCGLLPSDVICVLGSGDENVLETSVRIPVHANLLSAAESEVLARFQGLSGTKLNKDSLRVQHDQAVICDGGPLEFARAVSMPIMDDDSVVGLLTLADLQNGTPFTRSEIAVLGAASIQVGAVLSALRAMKRLGNIDPLSGVLNRMGFKHELERAWSMSRRHDFSLAVVLADVDSFKAVNNSYGHSVGDNIICEFADLISGAARSSDIIARYGGDEFVIVLLGADEAGAGVFAERLLNITREHLFRNQDERLKLTVSIGVSTTQAPIPPVTAHDLLDRADRALYTAKWEGKNRVCVWPGQALVNRRERAEVETEGTRQTLLQPEKLMVIDDEPAILNVIRSTLENEGLQVETFKNADSAIERLRKAGKEEFSVILTDLRMPGKTGLQFLHEIRAINDLAIKIVITGHATVESAVTSLHEGVYDIVQKPFRLNEFLTSVKKALAYYRLKIENARYREHLQEVVDERSSHLAASVEELRKSHEFTLEAMVAMLDAREKLTAHHSLRVRKLAVALGEKMGFSEEELETLAKGALLHDIGKISIPDSILLKTGPLLPEELEIMERHPETGYQILSTGFHIKGVAELVRAHHERYAGTGYPRRLAGKNIPVGARVFSVVDAYEAMRSERLYRAAMPAEEAIRELKEGSGTQFDPEIVDVALKCQPEFEWLLQSR
jgi:diguanylate cyclase (GGDEF)-like protein/putative nucleotidyltransferase with HDIG domain